MDTSRVVINAGKQSNPVSAGFLYNRCVQRIDLLLNKMCLHTDGFKKKKESISFKASGIKSYERSIFIKFNLFVILFYKKKVHVVSFPCDFLNEQKTNNLKKTKGIIESRQRISFARLRTRPNVK